LFPDRPAGALVDAIVAAEELGLDEVWVADEGVAREPGPVLAAAAIKTSRIRLATGITSPLLRHPGAVASTMATLDELSDGRAVLGLGLGGALTLDPLGIVVDRPVAVMRTAIETARSVLRRTASEHYEPPSHAMPARDVPIWVGARGPQLVRTAARAADGIFVSGCTPSEHDRIVRDAGSVGGTHYALYQSAHVRPSRESEVSWDEAHAVLASEVARLRPDSIGLSLVDLVDDRRHDVVRMVERAASLLLTV
jgi:5,10-methylenetetrahydromethanopterin reductase